MKPEVGQLRRWASGSSARGHIPPRAWGRVFLVIGEESYSDGMYRTPVIGHTGNREAWGTKFMTDYSEAIDETR